MEQRKCSKAPEKILFLSLTQENTTNIRTYTKAEQASLSKPDQTEKQAGVKGVPLGSHSLATQQKGRGDGRRLTCDWLEKKQGEGL